MRKPEVRNQVNAFITDLYALAEHCLYGALHDDIIHDHLVVGVQDVKLSEKL